MDIIHQTASVTKAVVDAGDYELYQELQDISVKAYDLTMENIELKNKISELQKIIDEEKEKIFKNQAYYFGDEGPYCTKCYDDEYKKIRMLEYDTKLGTIYNRCPKCQNQVFAREGECDISF